MKQVNIEDIDKETVVISLFGDLTEKFSVSNKVGFLKEKKYFVIKNDGISNWNQDTVVDLYTFLRPFLSSADFKMEGLPGGMERLLMLALQRPVKRQDRKTAPENFLEKLGGKGIFIYTRMKEGLKFFLQVINSWRKQLSGKAVYRTKDFWFALEDCGPKALMIVSLISFMVGLILAFVGSLQLKSFGAQIYVASLVTIGMIRIMGAVMTGIIMAGRTGASYAATIGTMQVNEELDALQTMGISKPDFLVLPRMNALLLSMPILVLVSDFMGILGGCCVSVFLWDIPLSEYIKYSVNSFGLNNFFVGIFHGVVFGFIIVLCGCYFGITCGRNADSVGKAATDAVVYAIVWMIVMTGFITLLCEGLGI